MSTARQMRGYFEYLDELRASGETNMFGAAPDLAREFNIGIREARDICLLWRDTFSTASVADRVRASQPPSKH